MEHRIKLKAVNNNIQLKVCVCVFVRLLREQSQITSLDLTMLNIQRVSSPMKDKILTKAIAQKCSHSWKHRHIHAHRHEHTCMHTRLHIPNRHHYDICIDMHAHTCTHTHTHAHAHTHTHTHTQITKLLTLPEKNDMHNFLQVCQPPNGS